MFLFKLTLVSGKADRHLLFFFWFAVQKSQSVKFMYILILIVQGPVYKICPDS